MSIVLLVAYTILLYTFDLFSVWVILPIVSLLFYVQNGLKILKRVLIFNIFIAIVFVSLYLQGDGKSAFEVLIRSNALILFMLLLMEGKNGFDIAYILHSLRLPKKLVALIFFSVKFIEILFVEFENFQKILTLRGIKLSLNRSTCSVLAAFCSSLLLKAINRSKMLENVMILRGFNGQIYSLQKNKIEQKEVFCALCILVLIFFIF